MTAADASTALYETLGEAGRRRVVVVADHTKWGVIGLCSILELDQAEVLVTDAEGGKNILGTGGICAGNSRP